MKQALVLFLALAILPSIACKTKYTITLEGGTSLNSTNSPSEGGNTFPVKARVYQLKDAEKFSTLPFDEIWENAKTSLGADLLDAGGEPVERTVLALEEGQKESQPQTSEYIQDQNLNEGTLYFGVAALFKPDDDATQEQKARWKRIVSTEEIKKKTFHLDHFELTVTDK